LLNGRDSGARASGSSAGGASPQHLSGQTASNVISDGKGACEIILTAELVTVAAAVPDCVTVAVSLLDAVHELVLDTDALAVRDCRRWKAKRHAALPRG
jgi:hypothetical protein